MQGCIDLTSDGESPAGECDEVTVCYSECMNTGHSQLLCVSDESIWPPPPLLACNLQSCLKQSNRQMPTSCDHARILDCKHAGPTLAAAPRAPGPCITLLSSDEERSSQKPVVARNTAAAGRVPQASFGPGLGSVHDGPSGSLPQSSSLSPVSPSTKSCSMQPVKNLLRTRRKAGI